MSALDSYQEAVHSLSELWEDYHVWYTSSSDPRICKTRRRLICSSRLETKKRFYREIRKKSALKHIKWARVLDERRFDTFSAIFYKQTKVDVEFTRREIYKMLR